MLAAGVDAARQDQPSFPPPPESGVPTATTPVGGLHVLLVEDQTLIALDTESMLREIGANLVDAFTTAEGALAWLAAMSPDVGVLDISLGATTSFAIADELQKRALPFLFTTGYREGDGLPERFAHATVVRKPYTVDALAEGLAICLSGRRNMP